jgi:hypothetical protein
MKRKKEEKKIEDNCLINYDSDDNKKAKLN